MGQNVENADLEGLPNPKFFGPRSNGVGGEV